jgi:hypothetical protein
MRHLRTRGSLLPLVAFAVVIRYGMLVATHVRRAGLGPRP